LRLFPRRLLQSRFLQIRTPENNRLFQKNKILFNGPKRVSLLTEKALAISSFWFPNMQHVCARGSWRFHYKTSSWLFRFLFANDDGSHVWSGGNAVCILESGVEIRRIPILPLGPTGNDFHFLNPEPLATFRNSRGETFALVSGLVARRTRTGEFWKAPNSTFLGRVDRDGNFSPIEEFNLTGAKNLRVSRNGRWLAYASVLDNLRRSALVCRRRFDPETCLASKEVEDVVFESDADRLEVLAVGNFGDVWIRVARQPSPSEASVRAVGERPPDGPDGQDRTFRDELFRWPKGNEFVSVSEGSHSCVPTRLPRNATCAKFVQPCEFSNDADSSSQKFVFFQNCPEFRADVVDCRPTGSTVVLKTTSFDTMPLETGREGCVSLFVEVGAVPRLPSAAGNATYHVSWNPERTRIYLCASPCYQTTGHLWELPVDRAWDSLRNRCVARVADVLDASQFPKGTRPFDRVAEFMPKDLLKMLKGFYLWRHKE
jgi:hypothetical protein